MFQLRQTPTALHRLLTPPRRAAPSLQGIKGRLGGGDVCRLVWSRRRGRHHHYGEQREAAGLLIGCPGT